MRPTIAILALLAAFALVACGGDDTPKEADSPPSGEVATQPRTNDGQKPDARANRAREKKRAGRPEPSRRPLPSEELSPAERARVTRRAQRIVAETRRKLEQARRRALRIGRRLSKRAQPRGTKQEAFRAAKKVCGSFLPTSVSKGRDPEDVARRYARAWPENRRQAAEDGCLAGLREDRR
jgi:hypothetical protein